MKESKRYGIFETASTLTNLMNLNEICINENYTCKQKKSNKPLMYHNCLVIKFVFGVDKKSAIIDSKAKEKILVLEQMIITN